MKKLQMMLIVLVAFFFTACATHTHVVGNGAQSNVSESKRQLWVISLVPINDVDAQSMAGAGVTDYEITTQANVIDIIIGMATGNIITSRTVTVTK